ncbi:transposase [Nitrolancea hollandica Lb]|uniref:Transposase n=1 Tax=Nitrolancea hollandica Lb TaxID=1129897 RepID=I4EMV9_9BACT|nr:transposase [Nitrolancea hollandica Lb]
MLEGEPVPANANVVSSFEPQTAVIRKDKLGHPVEFGRVVWLDEVEGELVSRYAVLVGNPDDAEQLRPVLDHHVQCFGHTPHLLTGDRKGYSREGEDYARDQGVRQVVLPQAGRRSPERVTHEEQGWFRRGRRWRAGIEGRISVLKRRHQLVRCHNRRPEGMERWVGWGVITHNLLRIAAAMA